MSAITTAALAIIQGSAGSSGVGSWYKGEIANGMKVFHT